MDKESDDLFNAALEQLVVAATENKKLRNENNKLRKKLFQEVIKYETKNQKKK